MRKGARDKPMIDNLSLGLSHGLMMLAIFLLLRRPELDQESSATDEKPATSKRRWGKPRA